MVITPNLIYFSLQDQWFREEVERIKTIKPIWSLGINSQDILTNSPNFFCKKRREWTCWGGGGGIFK